MNRRHIGVAQPHRGFNQRVEHRLQIERRAADDLEHISGGGLLLQRLAQLVEQARVLYGDDGLLSEVAQELDMLVTEWFDLLAEYQDRADELIILKHRHSNYRPITALVDATNQKWIPLDVGPRRLDVGDVSRLFRDGNTTKGRIRGRSNKWIVFASLGIRGCRAVHRNDAKCVSFAEIQIPELSVADARRVLQHQLEHGLQIAREAAEDLQHLGSSRLLLQRLCKVLARLGELAPRCFKLLFQIGVGCAKAVNVSSRLRSGRTKIATARSALRPVARQGHLVGTVTGPPLAPIAARGPPN